MNNKHMKQLGINSEVFNELRDHFDTVLQRTFCNMQSRGCDSADISVKLSITIDKVEGLRADDYGVVRSGTLHKPTFAHKVSATMKIKDVEEGSFKEDYNLTYDPSVGEFVLVPILDRQTRMELEDDEDEDE